MAFSKALNKVCGYGRQTIEALKAGLHSVRYGALIHESSEMFETDQSGTSRHTFVFETGTATSVALDFVTGTTYDPGYNLSITITTNGIDHFIIGGDGQYGSIEDLYLSAANGVITCMRGDQAGGTNLDLVTPIPSDFTGFGKLTIEAALSYDPEPTVMQFSVTEKHN